MITGTVRGRFGLSSFGLMCTLSLKLKTNKRKRKIRYDKRKIRQSQFLFNQKKEGIRSDQAKAFVAKRSKNK
jgi:hypothetical protein